jgi:fatty acid desaturase
MDTQEKKNQAYRKGVYVFILLAILTAAEYLIARISPMWWALLMVVALVKAFFILRDYMHIAHVFASEEEEG